MIPAKSKYKSDSPPTDSIYAENDELPPFLYHDKRTLGRWIQGGSISLMLTALSDGQ